MMTPKAWGAINYHLTAIRRAKAGRDWNAANRAAAQAFVGLLPDPPRDLSNVDFFSWCTDYRIPTKTMDDISRIAIIFGMRQEWLWLNAHRSYRGTVTIPTIGWVHHAAYRAI